jgi:hypothetical protein
VPEEYFPLEFGLCCIGFNYESIAKCQWTINSRTQILKVQKTIQTVQRSESFVVRFSNPDVSILICSEKLRGRYGR